MRVVFMGTPEFAVTALDALCAAGMNVVAVYTQPDRPRNRGMKLRYSPVKEYALTRGLPVLQPNSLHTQEALEEFRALRPDVAAVVAYGRLLPETMLHVPPHGCINVHASLLPKYRGAAPVQHAIWNGERETGVCTMLLNQEMDAGDLLDCVKTPIGEYETYGSLYDRLGGLGAKLLVVTLRKLESGALQTTPQQPDEVSYAPPITKAMCPIDWSRSAEQICNQIRALNPRPSASAVLGGEHFKIHAARKTDNRSTRTPGSLVSCTKRGIEVACGDGRTLLITEIQPANGKKMQAADYLRGHTLSE